VEDFPYARYAQMLGFRGIRVEHPEDVAGAWREAFEADVPTVIEFLADPDVPPMPPHVTFEQMKRYVAALSKGDPDAPGVIRQTLREMFA
jgi:pyruvate dehydrogenase (quinone)